MLRTILFDLDGTLLPIDTDRFVHGYMKALAAHTGHLVSGEQLVHQIMASTYEMIKNTDPEMTNAQVFAADFFPKIGKGEEELLPLFDQFYREQFPSLRSACPGLPGIGKAVVQTAVDKGYEIVLATNPLFPRMAIEERMRWVGIEDMPWRLVTVYEEMHACKPQPAYYQEILAKVGRAPEECLMVGNDVEEDGVAGRLGMGVYFVTNHLINRSGLELPPDRSGTLADFLVQLKTGL